MIAAGEICDELEQRKCEAAFGEHLEWACDNCEKKSAADLHDYTKKLFHLRQLKLAGYPFGGNDLSLEEWIDLGRLEEALIGQQEHHRDRPDRQR